jgi:hypothetical protein
MYPGPLRASIVLVEPDRWKTGRQRRQPVRAKDG